MDKHIFFERMETIKKYCNFKIDNHIIEVELYSNCLEICKIWYYYKNNFKSIELYWNNEKNDFLYNHINTFFTPRQKTILLKRIKNINYKINDFKKYINIGE